MQSTIKLGVAGAALLVGITIAGHAGEDHRHSAEGSIRASDSVGRVHPKGE
jgi:hypothetical protein